jgi:transcriptional regulator with XRE-family HTH domain
MRLKKWRGPWHESLVSLVDPANDQSGMDEICVGRRLREIRKQRGLSIRSLAEVSGLNFNTLSLIENERSSPSVSTLQQLARALGVPITAFFETESIQKEIIYQKSGKRPRAYFSQGILEDMGSGLTLGEGLPLVITLEPGADSGSDPIVHSGQEFVYCLEGELTYFVGGDQYQLGAGDSLIFQAYLPHRWGNVSQKVSRSILILCPSDENDRLASQHFLVHDEDR